MSTTPRRKSHTIQKSSRSKSKTKNKAKRYSTNNIRSNHPHSHTTQPHRYSHHGIQPSPHNGHSPHIGHSPHMNGINNGYHQMDDAFNTNIDNNYEDSPPPLTSKPTHKKNAVSSFLSIFQTFSQSKVRRTNSNNIDIDSMSDLEILKRMKRRILDILSKMLDSKKLKKIKSELKSEVWENEYSELKKRLGAHDIHTATMRQKFVTAKSLKQLSSLHSNNENNDGDDEDVREMATFLLQEYFDQPTVVSNDKPSIGPLPSPLLIPNTIKEGNVSAASGASGVSQSDDDDDHDHHDHDDDDQYYSDHSVESFNDEDDEKKIKMDPNYNPLDIQQIDNNINNKHRKSNKSNKSNKRYSRKKRKSKKRKYKQRKSGNNVMLDGNMSDGVIALDQRRMSKSSKSHRYSPRPISPLPKAYNIGYNNITDIDDETINNNNNNNNNNNSNNDDVLNIVDIDNNNNNNNKDNKEHRIEIRHKFRRGVRKAMLVNAWTGITAETDNNPDGNKKRLSLTLSNQQEQIEMIQIQKEEEIIESPSYSSTPFMSFMSDNLMNALSKVGTWEFDPFEFFDTPEIGGKGLIYSVWYLFDKYDLFKIFPSISPKKFMKFLSNVEDGYIDNPYHNKIHATDVVSNVAYYLNNTQFFKKHISAFDKFTAILSAAVHDLGHDGNNNAYHITTMSDLAITYNDISVLENYHIASTFKILKRSDCNWYQSLTKPVQKYFRLAMIDIVLATDMKFHNKKLASLTGLVAVLKQQLNKKILLRDDRDSIASTHSIPLSPNLFLLNSRKNGSQSSLIDHKFDLEHKEDINKIKKDSFDSSYTIKPKTLSDFPLFKYKVNEVGVEHLLNTEISDVVKENGDDPRVIDVYDERRFILMWVVHLCDISNCAKSLKSGKKWAVRVMTEFFKQGDRERSMGLEVSAMMDRRRSSTPQGQIGFIKFILRPSYNMFVRLVPEASKPLEILNENLEYWEIQQKLMNQQRKKRAHSVGSIAQTPTLNIIQDQLKKLNLNRRQDSSDNDDNDDDDANSQKSVEIKDIKDIENNPNRIESQIANNDISSRNNKHVGFKDNLVIIEPNHNPNILHNDSSSIDESEITVTTPRTTSNRSTSNRSLNLNLGDPKLAQSQSHHIHASSNLSIDSNNSLELPYGPNNNNKLRAHSIHVSIPTSDKQIQSQPQPFTAFLAELRKEQQEQQEQQQQSQQSQQQQRSEQRSLKRKTRKQRTNNLMKNVPKVTQSISLPVGSSNQSDDDDGLGASITPDINININVNNNNNINNIDNIDNNTKHDVV